jgi:hypothetical protein
LTRQIILTYHAAFTLERRKTEGPALFRQFVKVTLYTFRREFSFFDDAVRVQDAVFESGQERLAVVGHGGRFSDRTAGAGAFVPGMSEEGIGSTRPDLQWLDATEAMRLLALAPT